jgi:hypothetical protein
MVSNLSLAEWLPRLTKDHATGEGRVSGKIDVLLDLSEGSKRVVTLGGGLFADPQHGYVRASDAEAIGELLDSQDPRFATDPVMRPVREKIVAALQDFAFTRLAVDFSREGENTLAGVSISGFGRHGADPQGLNLTINLHVQDALVNLASRVAALSKAQSAAADALDRFFGMERSP